MTPSLSLWRGRARSFGILAMALWAGCVLPEVTEWPAEQQLTNAPGVEQPDSPVAPVQTESSPTEPSAPSSETEPQSSSAAGAGAAEIPSAGAAAPQGAAASGVSAEMCGGSSYRCRGALLEQCTGPSEFTTVSECTSATLCDAGSGKCTPAACAPGSAFCTGNVLSTCKRDGTGYDSQSCGAKFCSTLNQHCDFCKPMSKRCETGALLTCTPRGDEFMRVQCPSSKPICRDERCVECVSDGDCPVPTDGTSRSECTVDNRCVESR
jgi:hypothetical protein